MRKVIFPTNDFHVRMLSRNRDELNRHYRVSTDSSEVTDISTIRSTHTVSQVTKQASPYLLPSFLRGLMIWKMLPFRFPA